MSEMSLKGKEFPNEFLCLVACYEEGGITHTELYSQLMQVVTEENCHQIESLSPELLVCVRSYLIRQPITEEDWAKLRFFAMIMWARGTTQEYVDNYWEQQRVRHRRGVEILRRYFQQTGKEPATHHTLVITAADPHKDIWLSDDNGNPVQSGHGVLATSLLPGTYKVRFGLHEPDQTIELVKDTGYHQEDE